MKARTALIWLIGLLTLASLACAQAGEIITPEEATARAEAAYAPVSAGEGSVDALFQEGDMATLTGKGFLVNLMDQPGGKIAAGQQRGAAVEVLGSASFEDEVWYMIKAGTGEGWVKAENLELPETEADEAAAETTFAAGDTAYLVGKSFLVSLMQEAGGNRMIAGQERGAEVSIVEATVVDGEEWYLIDAPTGQGWVPLENLTTEAP